MQTNDKEEQEERREVMHGAHQLLEGLDALERPHGLEQLRRQATTLPTTTRQPSDTTTLLQHSLVLAVT